MRDFPRFRAPRAWPRSCIGALGPMTFQLFRKAAIDHQAGEHLDGDVLRVQTRWTKWSLRLIGIAAVVALVFVIVFDVTEYAEGAAIVRVEGRRPMLTMVGGIVEAVHVQPGQHVEKDQWLATVSAPLEEAEYRRANTEFRLSLAALLRDPSDHTAKATLASLKPKRDSSAQIANARFIRAPHAGIVTDVRVRPGQYLTPNEVVCGIAPEGAEVSLIGLMPGEYRPMLRAGQPLRFSLSGYKFEYRNVEVESVGEEVVGPTEMRRYLGQEVGDAIALPGPTVLVKARLPSHTFTTEGQTFSYAEGLTGLASVRVRKEPILVVLIPALKAIRPRH
ncbi:HlyD family efflux transporter periplasmic adaptor subunit [Pendulispora brunnea]|uniref:HlyD family efflux transporter periplasmic adaptor subunit n=1 Tax=Pendulispora brunnea TaxID=2905690 RepID=A0ABZ2K7T9_9BACT